MNMVIAENAPKPYRKFANLVMLSVAESVIESGGIEAYVDSLHISSPDDVDGSMFPALKAYLIERMTSQQDDCGTGQQSGID